MLYDRYQAARDAAWRTLLKFEVCSLPVDVEAIAGKLGIEILSRPEGQEEGFLPGSAAVTLRKGGRFQVLMQKGLSYSRYRFALAHELGHIILQHPMTRLPDGALTFTGLENAGDVMAEPKDDSDTDADMFAIRLLAPACVLHSLHMETKECIAALCGLPEGAAALRAERMALLDHRNAYGIHPLEKQVQKQFAPFIRTKRQEQVPEKKQPERPVTEAALPARPAAPEKKALPLWLLAAAAAIMMALGFFLFRG